MIRTKRRMRLCMTLLVLNLLFIWGNSLMPGHVSAAFSQWVKDLLAAMFPFGPGDSPGSHGLLRKLAHFTEFCCLGLSLFWLFSMLGKKIGYPLGCGLAAACLDETIQCFVPDRGPSVWDVMIDTAGVSLGVVILSVGYAIYKKRKTFLEEI